MSHNLASGIVIVENEKILLVKDKHGWTLPKGSIEKGESFKETALREGNEETGFDFLIDGVAFITEYKTREYGQYLQVYYSGNILSKTNNIDPDDVIEIKFVPIIEVREYIKFRAWIIPLEYWLEQKKLRYHSFDLDVEGFEI
ncbi:NUDIX hydrolase [Paenibacillus psychroresistens]|uniref:NUDIX hydrolase n=1 Tax=Paenibacillus psychroresistens TaxID=1778678 RepID=A0A6B8RML0_9BACL|nr:NUDIX hydrolase [Paenibacillus psychroresistens]QGQ96588.1 NUDIX hydrolase [Paenibacillus psychroresistens]